MRAIVILVLSSIFAATLTALAAAGTADRRELYEDFPANAAERRLQARGFGPPRNAAEWAFDQVLGILFSGHENENWFTLEVLRPNKLVWVVGSDDTSDRLTSAYRAALATTPCSIGAARVTVDGKKTCGFFEVPMLCDDTSRGRYFKTLRASDEVVVFRELSVDVRMVLEDGRWKIDGTLCTAGEAKGLAINWDRKRSGR